MLNEYQQIFDQISKARNVLICFNKNWFGDSLASGLTWLLLLAKMDKPADLIVDPANQQQTFAFLPGFEQIKTELNEASRFIVSLDVSQIKIKQIKYKLADNRLDFIIAPQSGSLTANNISSQASGFNHDLIIALGSPDLDSLGQIYENNRDFFYKTPIINLDNQPDNEDFGQINLIDLNAVAISEITYNLMANQWPELVDEELATCLLAGIIAQTKNFKTNKLTPQVLLIVSELIQLNARREEIIDRLYRNKSLAVLQLWGKILARLSGDLNNQLIFSKLTYQDFSQAGNNLDDLTAVIDELIISIPQAAVIVILIGLTADDQQTLALVYAVKNIDAIDLLKEYNPQGTKKLAQAILNQSLSAAAAAVQPMVKNKLVKIIS